MPIPVKLFRNNDSGAPSLSGQAGSLIALLNACLVNGYNNQAVQSITRSGSVATVTFAANHNFRIDGLSVIRLAGADQAEYNGDFRISNITATSFDIDVTGSPATPATGTLTAKVAPMGWANEFSGTNQAVYRSADTSGGQRAYYRVIDTTTTYAQIVGYEAMTAVDVGADGFGSVYWHKSSTGDATARAWVLVADDRAVILLTAFHASHPGYAPFGFGDIVSEVTNDVFGGMVLGHNLTATPTTPGDITSHKLNMVYTLTSARDVIGVAAGRLSRDGVGLVKNIAAYLVDAFPMSSAATGSMAIIGSYSANQNYMLAYPNPPNGGVYASRIAIMEASGTVSPFTVGLRGWLPGLYAPLQSRPIAHLTTYDSVSAQTAGRKFLAVNLGHSSDSLRSGQCHLDLTGPWR